MKKTLTLALALLVSLIAGAQQKKAADTVVVELAKTSKMVFTMKDRADLPQLKQYDSVPAPTTDTTKT